VHGGGRGTVLNVQEGLRRHLDHARDSGHGSLMQCSMLVRSVLVWGSKPQSGCPLHEGESMGGKGKSTSPEAEGGVPLRWVEDRSLFEWLGSSNEPTRVGRRGRERWLTPNAAVVEAAPPRTGKRNRAGGGDFRTG
jgi:hypothetical protein